MALIDALVDKITDGPLRKALRQEVDGLLEKQKYGLVFQQHKPETVELYAHTIRRNCKVRILSEPGDDLYRVQSVKAGKATITSTSDEPTALLVDVDDLVVVREFGDAIYPGLESTGKVERGGNKPPHLVINAENFHALELLLYTHRGKIDLIYIDPPYNSGARDWKYNNDYIDGVDWYRHSKWLAFMQRRLELAQHLLADDGVLVVTIDENEVHHLGMLIDDMFSDSYKQMITIVTNQRGVARGVEFARVDEYAFVVFRGDAAVVQGGDDLLTSDETISRQRIDIWNRLMRRGTDARRQDSKNLFYPIFIHPRKRAIVKVGDPLPLDRSRHTVTTPRGLVAVWPIRTDGSEGRWTVGHTLLKQHVVQGMAKVGAYNKARDQWSISYLISKDIKRIESGEILVDGKDSNGVLLLRLSDTTRRNKIPRTVWHRDRHNAGTYGSELQTRFVPGRKFPFPKSLYAVEDMLAVFLSDKREAKVLDFFAGSGTTAHAVALLNSRDGGKRQAILVTNNEVSVSEASALRSKGLRPGDSDWETQGIFQQFTKPRLEAAITGLTHDGTPVRGEYLGGDPFEDGLEENAEFFNLTYEDRDQVENRRKFEALAPMLWLAAGASGPRVDRVEKDWALPEGALYGVLFDDNKWRDFADAVNARGDEVTHVFAVTESTSTVQQMRTELPSRVTSIQLYSDYLKAFEEITKGRS